MKLIQPLMFANLKHRIFLRIYAGLLLLCLFVAVLAYQLLNVINDYRAQKYREAIATGTFHVITQDIARQPNQEQREFWISDASNLFGSDLQIIPTSEIKFSQKEKERLAEDLSVVRFNIEKQFADIYHKIPNEDNLVFSKITQIDEQKVRALGIFLLDDLSYYSTEADRDKRLQLLSDKFPFDVKSRKLSDIDVDSNQLSRLHRGDVVVIFRNGTSSNNTKIDVLVPSSVSDSVIEVGSLSLFNWFPLKLVVMVVIFAIFLISVGVYALILPLERKLQLLQLGLNDISEGKLDTRLKVQGEDETAKLSATFNAMVAHIKRLIESQRELTRAVSHELRTPVSRIRFAVDMLADTEDEESRKTQRDFIDQDIEELNGLIDEILTYAKLEEGSPKMNWETVDLKALLEQVVRETNALGKPVKVTTNYVNLRSSAEADKRYLHRVVQNLVGNALRYADKEIILSAGVQKGMAFVCVEDDGQGIPDEDREKIFTPFARLDDSRTRASGGYGLGLSIVSRICFWFNGEMLVDKSLRLGGARFKMEWPAKQLTQTIVADELTQEHNERKTIQDEQIG